MLLQAFAAKEGIRPVLLSLVPGAGRLATQNVLWLNHHEGVEILEAASHPWPNAIASVMARGYRGDFLAAYQLDGKTDFKLIEYRGEGIRHFAEGVPTLDDFKGPLASEEEAPLDAATRSRMAETASVFQSDREMGTCMYPLPAVGSCSEPTIRSHSVGRAAHLMSIAESGHVYGYSRDALRGWLRPDDSRIALLGTRHASTFPGFCSAHDHELFGPIDCSPIDLTRRHAALLCYRALCYEVHAKRAAFNSLRKVAGLPALDELLQDVSILQSQIRRMVLGYRDVEVEKGQWERVILDGDETRVRFHAIRVSQSPEVLGAACLCPPLDFQGRALQDLDSPEPAAYVSVSIMYDGNTGLIVFVWLHSAAGVGEAMVRSLLRVPQDDQADLIVRLLFAHSDNIYWSPRWWRELPETARKELQVLMDVGVVPWLEPLSQSHLVQWTTTDIVRAWS